MVMTMAKIEGITVTLHDKIQTGTDGFDEPIYTEVPIPISDVLVYPSSGTEILETVNLYGKKAVYTLAIPKGDTHDWENKKVTFFGKDWHTFGIPTKGIDENIPLRWNTKVMVERYE